MRSPKEDLELFKSDYNSIASTYRDGSLSKSDLDAWKLVQLKKVLGKAKKNSPFYQCLLAEIDIERISLDSLEKIPFTTKDDLRTHMQGVMSGSMRDAAFYYETTGTTGAATPCPRDKKESYASNLQLQYAYEDVINSLFKDGEKPILGIMGPTEVHSFSDTLESIAFELDMCSAKIWPGSPVIGFDKCLSLIKNLGIEVLATSPGQVMTLAKEAKKRGLDPLTDFSVKAFMLSGELCTPALAKNLESLWGAKIFNSLYGSQEAFVIASTTPNNELRPHLPNYIFEVIDPTSGERIGDSGIGELAVTNLVDGVKPLIRYRTGDIVRLEDTRSSNLFERYRIQVVGRVKDAVTLNGINFTAAEIEETIMGNITGCLGYQIIIANTSNKDSIIVKFELPGLRDKEKKLLIRELTSRVQDDLCCESTIMIVDDLSDHVNLGGWIKWKAARLIDTRETLDHSDDPEVSTNAILERLNK